ncbi:hypothetical protein MTP99_010037 [Tenebrio molitor]|jgi:hypothetical protein|nr:hypothetical protein MTP99_010037 [Tenebrio molitor]
MHGRDEPFRSWSVVCARVHRPRYAIDYQINTSIPVWELIKAQKCRGRIEAGALLGEMAQIKSFGNISGLSFGPDSREILFARVVAHDVQRNYFRVCSKGLTSDNERDGIENATHNTFAK